MKQPLDSSKAQWNKSGAKQLIWDYTGSETGSIRTNSWSTGDQEKIMLETMSLNTIPLIIIKQCAQLFLWTSFANILLVLTHKIAYRDYLYVCSGDVIIPLWIHPLTVFKWLVRYDSYCSHKTYGTSEPPFPSTKGYMPSITSIIKLQSIKQINNSLLINLLTMILPMETP